jgi:hypothetical protein
VSRKYFGPDGTRLKPTSNYAETIELLTGEPYKGKTAGPLGEHDLTGAPWEVCQLHAEYSAQLSGTGAAVAAWSPAAGRWTVGFDTPEVQLRFHFVNSLRGRPIGDFTQPIEAYVDGEDVSLAYAEKMTELYRKARESARTAPAATDPDITEPRGVQGGQEQGVRVRNMVVLRE